MKHCYFVAFVLLLPLATHVQSRELHGEVKDQFQAVIVGAKIILQDATNTPRETVSDANGAFHFRNLSFGSYKLNIKANGFGAYNGEQQFDAQSPRLSITLYPIINDAIAIDDETNLDALEASRAAGTQILKERELQNLSDDPDQFNQQLQMLAASAGSAPGQATITVDGFLSGRLPSKSAIREVRINPDLYSAEYDTPPFRGGRIEILTKPGASNFHGATFFNFNRTPFNARDPFAPQRADISTNRYGANFGGPLVRKRAGFFVDFEKRDIDEAAAINAQTLSATLQPVAFAQNIATPQRLLIGSARADWQANPQHTLILRYDVNRNQVNNRGVGGFDLAERASDFQTSDHNLRFTMNSVISSTKLNELRIGWTQQSLSQRANSTATAIAVAGAFTAGGARLQQLARSEQRLEFGNNLSIIAGQHSVKLGAQLFAKRFDELRAEDTNGTFFFGGGLAPELDAAGKALGNAIYISGLEQYRRALLKLPGGTPTRFTLTRGAPDLSLNQWQFAGFVQDEWRVRKHLSLHLGARYEGQTQPADGISFAPRIGLAYSPDKKQLWVLRARAGMFYERFSESLPLEVLRLDGVRQQQILIDAPSFPNQFVSGTASQTIPTIRQFDAKLRPPASLQMRVEFERQLPKSWRVQMSHSWSSGWAALRSRNINAPLVTSGIDPSLAPRPFGRLQNLLQFESSGRIAGRVLYVGVTQTGSKHYGIVFGYLNFDFKTDADAATSLPQSSYNLRGEWARPFWQSRQRVFMHVNANLPWSLRAFVMLNAASGTPFNVTTGTDNNGDGVFNDRPNIAALNDASVISTTLGAFNPNVVNGNLPRNFGTNPATATIDFNLSRTFTLSKKASESAPKLTWNVRASNLLNRTNPLGVSGVLASPFFGRANAASPARRVEFGLRFSF